MPRPLTIERVSLNQIKRYLGNNELKRKKDYELIEAFFPKWSADPFGINAGTSQETIIKNVQFFCSGNRKGNRLANVEEINAIIDNVNNDSTLIEGVLERTRKWVKGIPPVSKDNSVFLRLVLKSAEKLSTYEEKQFDVLEQTIDKLRQENTEDSLAYALLLLVMVGVLQERITDIPHIYNLSYINKNSPYLKQITSEGRTLGENENCTRLENSHNVVSNKTRLMEQSKGGYQFVLDALQNIPTNDILEIDMAFHGGDHWLRDGEKVDLLEQIAKKGIPLRVLVNTEDAVEDICVHMRQRRRAYMGFDRAILKWKDWEADFPHTIKVRISDIPLLHRVYLIRKTDGTGLANITCYTYGNYTPQNDFKLCFGENSKEYFLFANEFDYLWEYARDRLAEKPCEERD